MQPYETNNYNVSGFHSPNNPARYLFSKCSFLDQCSPSMTPSLYWWIDKYIRWIASVTNHLSIQLNNCSIFSRQDMLWLAQLQQYRGLMFIIYLFQEARMRFTSTYYFANKHTCSWRHLLNCGGCHRRNTWRRWGRWHRNGEYLVFRCWCRLWL